MSIYWGFENFTRFTRGAAVTIGAFDGVHRGHQLLLDRLINVGKSHNLNTIAITFDKHPLDVLAPDKAPARIQTVEDRADRLADSGVDIVLVLPFTDAFAQLTPRDFIKHILIDQIGARFAVVGQNFRFGKGRSGDPDVLKGIGLEYGLDVEAVPPLVICGRQVSSTLIRNQISTGAVKIAAQLLGRHFAVRGQVVRGQGLGRQLGFPTANIQTQTNQLLPGNGIYAVNARFQNMQIRGASNVGIRPTINTGGILLEVHLIDFQGDLYDQQMEVDFLDKLRDEVRFDTISELTDQIQRDVYQAVRVSDGVLEISESLV